MQNSRSLIRLKRRTEYNRPGSLKITYEFNEKIDIKIHSVYLKAEAPVYWEIAYAYKSKFIPHSYKTEDTMGMLKQNYLQMGMPIQTRKIRLLAELMPGMKGKIETLGARIQTKDGEVLDLDNDITEECKD